LVLAAHAGPDADTGQAVGIEVTDAWIRWLPSGFPSAGYMTVTNTSPTEQVMTGADSPDYGEIGFHQTHVSGGTTGENVMKGNNGNGNGNNGMNGNNNSGMNGNHDNGMNDMSGMSGMSAMTPVARVVLKPHATVRFAVGGYHLMLMQPRRTLHPGDQVLVTLHFGDGRALAVPFQVREGS
jgi:copper(I)-binding protein